MNNRISLSPQSVFFMPSVSAHSLTSLRGSFCAISDKHQKQQDRHYAHEYVLGHNQLPRFSRALDKQPRETIPRKTQRSKTSHKFANPGLTTLLQNFQNVLGVHACGDEFRAVLYHRSEHAFTFQIHERHSAHVHDTFAASICTVRLFPIRFELRNPRT
jgi:hypothetical protein